MLPLGRDWLSRNTEKTDALVSVVINNWYLFLQNTTARLLLPTDLIILS